MGKLRRVVLGAGLAAVLVGAACVVTVWWEGSDSSISFNWTVNGQPASSACAAANGTTVRMWVSQYLPSCTLDNASCGTWDGSWEWTCGAGSGTTGLRFASVDMYVGWTLLNASGQVLSYTPWQRYTLATGDNNLGTIPFATATPGDDAAVVTTWTINGAAASAASCTAAGGANVVLTWRETGTTATEGMTWACATAGAGTTGLQFASSHSYDLRWELKNAGGTTISAAPGPDTWQTRTMTAGDNPFSVDFATSATPDALVTSTWTVNTLAASAANCDAAAGADVVLVYRTGGGASSEVTFTCADGTGATATVFVSGQAYELRWELRHTDGTVLSAAPGVGTWQAVTPVAGNNPITVNLPVELGHLDVTLEWADKVTSPAWGSCTSPPDDVAVIGYVLETTTGTVVASVDIDTSPLACTTALAWNGVPFGSYHLVIDGQAAAPDTAVWSGDCVGLAVDDLLTNAFNCQVPMVTP